MKLVPLEITWEMEQAYFTAPLPEFKAKGLSKAQRHKRSVEKIKSRWAAMLAAAPPPNFRWVKCPKFGVKTECFLGTFRLGATWFDKDREKWCAYFDNDHSTERTYETEAEAVTMVETRAIETIFATE